MKIDENKRVFLIKIYVIEVSFFLLDSKKDLEQQAKPSASA